MFLTCPRGPGFQHPVKTEASEVINLVVIPRRVHWLSRQVISFPVAAGGSCKYSFFMGDPFSHDFAPGSCGRGQRGDSTLVQASTKSRFPLSQMTAMQILLCFAPG